MHPREEKVESLWLHVDPLADYNPVQNLESYIDGNHNGGVYNSGNLNPYIYCYNSPIDYVDPNGKQSYFNSKVDAKGRRYLEFVSRNDEPSNPHWKGLTVVNVYDNTNRYVTDIVSATDAPGKVEAKYGSHYLKEKEHISGWEATKTVAKIAWESPETQPVLLAPISLLEDIIATKYALPALRSMYIEDVKSLGLTAKKMLSAGHSEENVARYLSKIRRSLGEKYKNMTPPELLEKIYQRNIEKYGDKMGPTIEYLRKQGKSWNEIIKSSIRTGGKDLGL